MTLEGTVVNGMIVLDGTPPLPEGVRVRVELALDDELDNMPLPPATETYEEHLAILRQSIAETRAGMPGIPLAEGMARIAAELNLPPVEPE